MQLQAIAAALPGSTARCLLLCRDVGMPAHCNVLIGVVTWQWCRNLQIHGCNLCAATLLHAMHGGAAL